ncbi:MAG: ATP-binding protein [Pseudobdellovibrionaceae bacterium]
MFLKKIGVKLRLTLILVFVFGLATLIFNSLAFLSMMKVLQQDFDTALYNYAVDVSDVVELMPSGDLAIPPLRLDNGKILPFPLGTALISVRHVSGKILAEVGAFGEFRLPYKPAFDEIWKGKDVHFATIADVTRIPQAEAENYRMVSFPLDENKKPQLLLQIAVPLTLLEAQVTKRLSLIQIGIPLILILATGLGYLFASRALRPVQQMIDATKKIQPDELSHRLPVPQARDEIQSLALTLNEMLSRMEQAFLSQERFVAEASHQLFSPLTILKGEMEVAVKSYQEQLKNPQGLNKDNTRQFIQQLNGLLNEVDHLTRLVQDMLLLARVDAGFHQLKQDEIFINEIFIDEIFTDAVKRVERLASKRRNQVQLKMIGAEEHRKPTLGAADLVFHMIYNLLENAIKFSFENSTIQVEIAWTHQTVELTIVNMGEPILSADLPLIFERFHRANSVAGKTQGHGLGLAICQKIANLHSAKIFVKSEGKLTQFKVIFEIPEALES